MDANIITLFGTLIAILAGGNGLQYRFGQKREEAFQQRFSEQQTKYEALLAKVIELTVTNTNQTTTFTAALKTQGEFITSALEKIMASLADLSPKSGRRSK